MIFSLISLTFGLIFLLKYFDEYDTCGLQYVAHNTDLSTCMEVFCSVGRRKLCLYVSDDQRKVSEHLRWVIGQVQEQTHILHRTILLKVLFEKSCSLHVDLQ